MKTGDGETHREFESHTLRHKTDHPIGGLFFALRIALRKLNSEERGKSTAKRLLPLTKPHDYVKIPWHTEVYVYSE